MIRPKERIEDILVGMMLMGAIAWFFYRSLAAFLVLLPFAIGYFRLKEKERKRDLEDLFSKAYGEAMERLFQAEDTQDCVRHSLQFSGRLCQGLVRADWEVGTSGYIRYDGALLSDQLPEEGDLAEITLSLIYEGEERYYPICLHLFPPEYTEQELLKKKLIKMLEETEKSSRLEKEMELPAELEGKQLTFVETKEKVSPGQAVFLGILLGIAGYVMADRRLLEKGRQRQIQMEIDYPEVVLKLTVLIRAGLTVRGAWERIVDHYERERKTERKPIRYVYEEMKQADRRIQGGLPEAEAYLEFGRRTHLHSYLRLSSLLEQNLKKGSRGLVYLLEAEADEAWNRRKNLAKQRGEEAGTRMLLPMLLMLIVVLIIIIVPAWMSF
jgi:tight adherence protein C